MESDKSTPKKKFTWKNRWVKESVYRQRLNQSLRARKRKSNLCGANYTPIKVKLEDNGDSESKISIGRRLVNIDILTKHMVCKCGSFLSLQNIEEESRSGLASIFAIRCQDCLFINSVPTDVEVNRSTGKTLYETNTRMILGLSDAGMGCTHLNKLLDSLDMPSFNNQLFQSYELEVGAATEKVAKKSCEEAGVIEQNLTLQNLKTLQEFP